MAEAWIQTLPQCAQEIYQAHHQLEEGQMDITAFEGLVQQACAELKGDTRPVLAVEGLAMGDNFKEAKKWLQAKLWVDNDGKPADFPTTTETAIICHCCHRRQEITLSIPLDAKMVTVGDLRQALKTRLVEIGYCRVSDGPIIFCFALRRLSDEMTLAGQNIRAGCVVIFNV